ncbi:MAG: hypothetical protein RMJ43_03245 [Chloroherpetonaceae bacterium]|nr:hypothetical protein [Chloroherpetonaceae bacterium]
MGLQEIYASLPEKASPVEERFEIALDTFLPGNPHRIVYRKLRASMLFGDRMQSGAKILKHQGLDEDDALLAEVALIALCHLEPVPASEAELYAFYARLFQALDEASKLHYVRLFSELCGVDRFARLADLEVKKNP